MELPSSGRCGKSGPVCGEQSRGGELSSRYDGEG